MKLMVIDGNSMINRSFYGIRPLSTRDGLYTHAVFGFLTTLTRLREEEKPDAVCVTFDVHAPTFRHTADESYKATRKPMPEELRMQMPVLKEVLDALNIPRYELEGWEADDLIGTISRRCEADGWECVVVTGDKDSLQLITDHTKVKLVSTRMGQTTTRDMTEETFREQYGFAPIHMIDLKALMGDASDNIPGVPGVGEKTAMGLVQMYGSIDRLYDHMPEIVTAPETPARPNVVKKLAEGEESARHSYWLATIATDAPLDFRPEENLVRAPGPEAYPLFLRLEFSKLIEKFGLTAEAETRSDFTATVEQVTDPKQAERLLEIWRKADHVSLLALPDLNGISVTCQTGENTTMTAELFYDKYQGDWNGLLEVLFSADIRKVSHNVKDLMRALLENQLPAEGFLFDTALAAYLLDATAGSYDLQRLFVTYYNEELPKPIYLDAEAFSMLGDVAQAEAALDSYAVAVDALYGRRVPMSASRMDKYKSCHFSYFMQYGLKAEPRRAAGFQAPEYGTFVHYVLEHVLRACRERGGVKEVPEEELRALAQAAVERYVSQELGGMEHETARFRYLFRRLLKSVYAVVDNVAEELRASQFQPISFELGFGAGKDLPPVELSVDGMTVSISGFVDRVDGWEHDGRLYLRVVDYKTGRKTFDLTDIWNGMGLQMLLYLFTLEREGEALYNREIIPAGVLYLPARDAVVAGSRAMSEAERRRKVDAELRRRGIVLDEPEVLAAMEEPGEAGIRFLPVKVNKAGAITGEALVSAERLGKLARHTGRILEEIGRELAAGNIAADPFWRGPDHNACQWCEYAAACHFEEGRGGDRRRFLPAVRGEEFWQAVAKEQV